jgi:hypothetical protein
LASLAGASHDITVNRIDNFQLCLFGTLATVESDRKTASSHYSTLKEFHIINVLARRQSQLYDLSVSKGILYNVSLPSMYVLRMVL